MAVAGDVPGRYDIVVNGQGYVFLDALESSLPFRTHRATYSYSPVFIPRQNVGTDYGDNQQDFYMTAAQRDWSLGEGQRFFRTDDIRDRRYFSGQNVNVSVEGQVTINTDTTACTLNDTPRTAAGRKPDGTRAEHMYVAGLTNADTITSGGAVTALGAHGLGALPARFGSTCDSDNFYLTSSKAGTAGVRRWSTTAAAWSTFSANAADSLAFLNNTLFGFREANGDLIKWDAAGAVTVIYAWKTAVGAAPANTSFLFETTVLRPFGGKLFILRTRGERCSEIWQYDGTNTSKLADLPPNFNAYDFDVAGGVAYVCGREYGRSGIRSYPTVYAYDPSGGTLTRVWNSRVTASGNTTDHDMAISAYASGVVFTDYEVSGTPALVYYDILTGAAYSIATLASTSATPTLSVSAFTLLHTLGTTTGYVFPVGTNVASSAIINTSLFDFESSLDKRFKAVKLDFDLDTTGNGGSVDIGYQLNSLDGSYTSLQTGAVAGTEYAIDQTARSLSLRITLNKGTSTNGPKLKRSYLRAVPIQPTYRHREYILDLSGSAGRSARLLRDGTPDPKTGAEQAADLITAATQTVPFSITDRFGTFTGILEPDGFELFEVHPAVTGLGSGEFVAKVTVREV